MPEVAWRFDSSSRHQKEKIKGFCFASLRSATNLYSILGEKTNSRFRKIWFEPMFFKNVVIAVGLREESRLAALFKDFTNSRAGSSQDKLFVSKSVIFSLNDTF